MGLLQIYGTALIYKNSTVTREYSEEILAKQTQEKGLEAKYLENDKYLAPYENQYQICQKYSIQ